MDDGMDAGGEDDSEEEGDSDDEVRGRRRRLPLTLKPFCTFYETFCFFERVSQPAAAAAAAAPHSLRRGGQEEEEEEAAEAEGEERGREDEGEEQEGGAQGVLQRPHRLKKVVAFFSFPFLFFSVWVLFVCVALLADSIFTPCTFFIAELGVIITSHN